MVRLTELLSPQRAIDAPPVTSQRELFEYVATELHRRGTTIDPKVLAAELLQRETLGSTGIGHGIALPHVLLDGISTVTAVVVRLASPLDWGAIDNEPVSLAILIVGPNQQRRQYLEALAELARALNQEQTRSRALTAHTAAAATVALAGASHQAFLVRHRRLFVFAAVVAAVFTAARLLLPRIEPPLEWLSGLHNRTASPASLLFQQELTVTLFVAMVVGTLLFWRFRVAIAAASLGTLLIAGVMDLHTTVSFMSIPTILFIMAMMVIVRWLETIGVFRFVVTRALQSVKGIPWLLLLVLMGFSLLLGGFADEVSAILVTFGLAQEVSRRTNTPLIPYVLCLVFATNVGSALTLVGNPIGVYLAFKGGLTFEDFLRWATPISAVTAIITAGLCLFLYRRHFFGRRLTTSIGSLEEDGHRTNPTQLRVGMITFCTVVLLIALHGRIEQLCRLGEGTALVAAALLAVGFIVFYEQEKGRELIERGIDWWTLLFFMFLFANAACLEYTGVTAKLGYSIHTLAQRLSGTATASRATTAIAATILLWFSGITSGFVDNLPIVAALAPVAGTLYGRALPNASILWWSLLLGGCFGGNLTAIGSTANLVAIGILERTTGKSIRFGEWIRVGVVVTLISLIIATVGLLIQLPLAPTKEPAHNVQTHTLHTQ